MPALNEERNLEQAVAATWQALASLQLTGEVLVVNDGSSDRTGAIADGLVKKFPGTRVIHHSVNKGIGSSFWDGAQACRGEVITLLPGDGENDPVEILRYLPLMQHVDIVIPFVYNREIRSLGRRWISKLYKAIINFTFGLLLNYMNGTVMYRRSVLQSLSLRSKGFFYQTELLIKAIRAGYLYAEVPYALKARETGSSTAVSFRSLWKLSCDFCVTAYSVKAERRGEILPNSATGRRRSLLR